MGSETRPPREGEPGTPAGEAVPAESLAALPPSEFPAPPPAASASELPDFAKKADDLEAIKKAVDDAASVGGGLWLSYLFVLFYLAVAAGAVTHADLFLEKPVKLPFLNVELPLLAFFFLAPILFLVVHAYVLVHLVMLADKARRFDQALHHQIGQKSGLPEGESQRRAVIRGLLQRQLPSNIFVQFLAGHADVREGPFGWLLRGIAWSTLVIAPVLLLLMIQIQFLPYHSLSITWVHRLALLADLILILWLSRKILSGREIDHSRRRLAAWAWSGLGLALSLGVVLFSIAVVTFPGELQEGRLPMSWAILPAMDEWGELRTTKDTSGNPRPASLWDWIVNARHLSVHDWLFVEERDQVTRRRFPFSSTLVLPGLNIYEGLGIDDPEKAKWHDFVFRARGRDLSGAIFDLASLPKVDFTGAQLQGASFSGAQLQGASLENAQLQGAVLLGAQLQSASLNYAQLQGAVVTFAQLQGASLENAQLQGASARVAQLQGAVLIGAQLQGASLNGAQLQGASLKNAQLQGASLDGARLQGASLDGAQLQGASLSAAALDATDLSDAWLWRTNAPSLPKPAAIRLADASWEPSWNDAAGIPHTWDDKAYQDLRKTIEAVRPRDAALGTVSRLDCASSDNSLASCDHDTKAPPEAAAWREALEAASVSDGAYSEALAKTLKGLVCSGGADAIHVVRGRGLLYRLHDCGVAAYDLVSVLTNKDSKDCPVAAALTDADRATLLMIKQGIEVDNATQKSAPSDTPQSP